MEQVEETFGMYEPHTDRCRMNAHSMRTRYWSTGNLQGSPMTVHCMKWSCRDRLGRCRQGYGLHPWHLSLVLHAAMPLPSRCRANRQCVFTGRCSPRPSFVHPSEYTPVASSSHRFGNLMPSLPQEKKLAATCPKQDYRNGTRTKSANAKSSKDFN